MRKTHKHCVQEILTTYKDDKIEDDFIKGT